MAIHAENGNHVVPDLSERAGTARGKHDRTALDDGVIIGSARATSVSRIWLVLLCAGGIALISSPSFGAAKATQKNAKSWHQIGIASWYGPGHHGKRTASGARFDMNAMTAAHPSLPLGTMLRVENLANGRSIVVRVNDRGPFTRNRIIDLSQAAAREIDLEDRGIGRVALSLVGRPRVAASSHPN
jgi:rare lipoprotein A